VAGLPSTDQARYVALVARCRTILDQISQQDPSGTGAMVQGEHLGRLTWVYLRLLAARRAMSRVLKEPTLGETAELDSRLERLKQQLAEPDLAAELRRSLESQVEIMEQRVSQRKEGRDKLDFLEAEIARIQEQVELLREQAALSTDADALAQRLDEISGSLGSSSGWFAEQQKLYGVLDELIGDPPPIAARGVLRESQ
jgi:hypothetical protein